VTLATGRPSVLHTGHASKAGTVLALSVTAQRVSIAGEELVVSLCRDVTAKRQADRELRSSESRYRSLVEVSPSPVVVYDLARTVLYANKAALDLFHAHSLDDVIGQDARKFVHPDSRESIAQSREQVEAEGVTPFRDVRLMRMDGTTVAAQMATSFTSFDGADAFQVVLQDVSHLQDIADGLRRTTEETISAMARLAETRDPYTSGHQARVAAMAFRIGKRMGLSDECCETIRLAGIVHDIGKMNVPAEILSKPGRLSEAEFALIQGHAEAGYELLAPIEFPWPIAEIVREHHERIDGSGYPRGISDGDICIEARVIAVADTVEAISSHRPYRAALGINKALEVITEGRGTLYDEGAVDAAVALAAEDALLEPQLGDPRLAWTA